MFHNHTQQQPTRADGTLPVRLTAIRYGGDGINLFEFMPIDAGRLPDFTAGSHIDVHLPCGIRQYSLANGPHEQDRYVLGIKNEANGRGGSRYMYEALRVGSVVSISSPRNNFPVVEDAEHSIFLAGGIGITPIHSMVQRLERIGKPWTLFYSVQRRSEAVFLNTFGDASGDFHLHVNDEAGGRFLDIAGIVSGAPDTAHFYCCGPAPMLAAFTSACEGLPAERVHLEYFSNDTEAASDGGFTVELARSGRRVDVKQGQTILDALREIGVTAQSSCEQGVCGTCETRVLSGIPDHRDILLSPQEKAANDVMMICCSGSRSPLLVLDL